MRPFGIFALVAVSCAAALAASSFPAAQWRLEVLRKKTTGEYAGIDWSEILGRLLRVDAETNGGRWALGSVRVEKAESQGACPVFFSSPIGPFRGRLADEWDLEHSVNKYLGLGRDTPRGLTPHVKKGDTVVELGAWIGTFTRHALMRGAGRVIALEPAPENLECLRITFAREIAEGRLTLVEAAAWNETARLRMNAKSRNNPRGSSKGYHVTPDGDFEVQGVRLDDVLADLGVSHVDLMNLDIEGEERYALAGAANTIQRSMPEIVVCVHHEPDDEEAVLGVLAEIAPAYRVFTDHYHARLIAP